MYRKYILNVETRCIASLLLWLCLFLTPNVSAQTDAIFISEYIEGNSNNKALELFNPGTVPVSLDPYLVATAFDNGPWNTYYRFPAGSSLGPDQTFVIVNSQTDPGIFDPANADALLTGTSVVSFNGNDAVGLFLLNGSDTVLIDAVGYPGTVTGLGWDVAGTVDGTRNHSLIRKPFIAQGDTLWDTSRGTNPENSEWEVRPADDFSDLGTHLFQPFYLVTAINLTPAGGNAVVFADQGTLQINAEILPQNASVSTLHWSSSDKLLASVDGNGLVHAFNNGTVSIKASATDGSGIADSIDVEITNQSGVEPVSSITVRSEGNTDTIRINQGSLQMYADVLPASADNKNVTWTIDHPGIAGIEQSGLLHAMKNGKVIITAAAADGSDTQGSKSIFIIGQFTEVNDIASLRQTQTGDGTVYQLPGEVLVTQSIFYNNRKYVQDAGGALEIDDPAGRITTPYATGDGMTGLMGYLEDYYGMLQLHPVEDPGLPGTKGNIIDPEIITLHDLNLDFEKYESRLVKINRLHFADAGKLFEDGKAYLIYNGRDTGVFRTEFFDEDYIGTPIPDSANVSGIATEFNGTAQLTARNLNDFETGNDSRPEFKVNNRSLIWPNPARSFLNLDPDVGEGRLIITDVSGKIIMDINMVKNIPKIDISGLNPGIYFVVLYARKTAYSERFVKL